MEPTNTKKSILLAKKKTNEPAIDDELLVQLLDMGYDIMDANDALIKSHNNLNEALEILLAKEEN